jgi:hypothetical protein
VQGRSGGRRVGRVCAAIALSIGISGSAVAMTATQAGACISFTPVDDSFTTKYGQNLPSDASRNLIANDIPAASLHLIPLDSDTFSTYGDGDNVSYPSNNGRFSYTVPSDWSGEDSFMYAVSDSCGPDNEDFGFVTIVVQPIVNTDSYTTVKNTTLARTAAAGVLANDSGYDDSFGAWDWTNGAHGAVDMNEDGSFTYTPATNFVGNDSFTYTVSDINGDYDYDGTVNVTVTATPPPPPPPPSGYWMVTSTGAVHNFGHVSNYGSVSTNGVTHFEPVPNKTGYWILNSAGRVFAKGSAHNYGGAVGKLLPGEIASSLSTTPTGNGYWIFTSRGRVLTFGAAKFFKDMSGVTLNGPVVGSIATPTGKGYYMVASDGGIFSFGDAVFRGSMGGAKLNRPVQGLVPTANNGGYWLVASDGGIFAFGNAPFRGSMGGVKLNKPVVGMVRYGNGYLMVGSDGGIFSFSNLPFFGSLGANPPPNPVVSVAT